MGEAEFLNSLRVFLQGKDPLNLIRIIPA